LCAKYSLNFSAFSAATLFRAKEILKKWQKKKGNSKKKQKVNEQQIASNKTKTKAQQRQEGRKEGTAVAAAGAMRGMRGIKRYFVKPSEETAEVEADGNGKGKATSSSSSKSGNGHGSVPGKTHSFFSGGNLGPSKLGRKPVNPGKEKKLPTERKAVILEMCRFMYNLVPRVKIVEKAGERRDVTLRLTTDKNRNQLEDTSDPYKVGV
jgi:hypothetical protein